MISIFSKHIFYSIAAAAAIISFPLSSGAAQKTRVFILSGQSNCIGAGNGELLPEHYKTPDAGAEMFSSWTRNVWAPLAPYPRKTEKFGIEKTAFGPELVFAKEMRKAFPDDSIAIIKQASGGTSVVAWEKNHRSPEYTALMKEAGHVGNSSREPQYPILLNTIKDGLAKLEGPYEISGFLWFQGERDARSELLSDQWAERVMALVENLSEDVGFSKDIPLFLMDPHFESNNLTTQPHGEPIVSALLSYAETGDAFTAQDLQTAAGLTELSSGDFLRTFQKVSGRWGGFF